jgi:hypothetical protein
MRAPFEPSDNATPKKKATPSPRRTGDMTAPKKTVVSQAVIDQIKRDGMTAALKKSASSTSAAYKEGVKRMYGTKRATAAVTATMKPKKAVAYGAGNAPAYRPGGATTKKNPSTSTKTGAYGKNNMPKYRPGSAKGK